MPENIDLIKTVFLEESYEFITAQNGKEAIECVFKHRPDLILLDVVMPEMNGFEVSSLLKSKKETMHTPIVMVTGMNDHKSRLKGIESGVDDFISKPINIIELKARVASLLRIKRYMDQLEYAERIFYSLAVTVESKDRNTKGHCKRLANYGQLLAEQIGLGDEDIYAVRRGGILHDIGNLAVDEEILLKPGLLTKEEYEIVKKHTEEGEKICKPMKTLENILPIIRQHHERFDGSGYPDGLQGEEISLAARIIALADSFDALTSSRIYRGAYSKEEALAILDKEAEMGKWDKHLYHEFKTLLKKYNIDYL
ncbi:MAG TPA: response regulator, partial [Calditrichaeota bacterium]|nr:response regulator [Calditrichota bacterium]